MSNDLLCDNRVDKTCESLLDYGLSVRLVGRRFDAAPELQERRYECRRLRCQFRKNALYYAELNIRLFFYLLFHRESLLWANDLDTLPANFLAAKLKRVPLIFDSHEHFTQVPELKANPFARKVWKRVEKCCVRRSDAVFTVCNPIKDYFKQEYGVESLVVRNMPKSSAAVKDFLPAAKKQNTIVWQGAVNVERGLEELVEAMCYLDAHLIIMGEGDIKADLEKKVSEWGLENKVEFTGRLPFDQMMQRTAQAKLAISIDKPTNGNYAISLPNKIFDYIGAAVPVLASSLQEIKPIVETYQTGIFIGSYTPTELAVQIGELLCNNTLLDAVSENCLKASQQLCWENEQRAIFETLDRLLLRK